ncbi:ubiquinol-cytochrome C reductase hinge domain-containing protein [Pavlovales sp. CCMP2436]|nr:ubiquinol-cytochrome C reductase hinge domain-containing protein [Pavlovales sp. CCMP2436]
MEEVPLVDPMPQVEKKCIPQCSVFWIAYQDCAERIVNKPDGHCTGQYLDYTKCVDHCVAHNVFKHVK